MVRGPDGEGLGFEDGLAVLFGEDAVVQDHHNAGVGLGADEATDALAEFEDGLGQGKFAEGIAAACLNGLNARFDERMIRHGKGEAGDDDVAQRFAGDIHALPKTVSAK